MLVYGGADLTARKHQLCLTPPTTFKYLEHKSHQHIYTHEQTKSHMHTVDRATAEETAADQVLDFCLYLLGVTALDCKTVGDL